MRIARKSFGLVIAMLLMCTAFTAGCAEEEASAPDGIASSGQQSGGEEGATGGEGTVGAPPELPNLNAAKPGIQFETPLSGASFPAASDVNFRVRTTYFSLQAPGGENKKGTGHYGVYVNSQSDQYLFKSYGTYNIVNLGDIPEGTNSLTAVLLNNDGTVVEDAKKGTIQIEVGPPNSIQDGPYLELLEPEDMTVVGPGQTLTVRVEANNILFVSPDGERATDQSADADLFEGHYRVYLGYDENDDYLAVGMGQEVEITLPETLVPGQHQLRVELWGVDEGLIEDVVPEYGQSITLVVPGLKKPEVAISSPSEGELLIPGSPVTMDLDIVKLELVPPGGLPGGEIDVADGHVRIYLDDATGNDYLTAEASLAPSFTVPEDISPGLHALHAVLVDTDGEPLGASASVNVTSPGFDVLAPTADSWMEYGKETAVKVDVTFFELLTPGEDTALEEGKGHYRVYLDDADGDDYLLASSDLETSIIVDETVAVGQHSLRFSLREKNGSPVGLDREIDVFVGSGPPTVIVQSPFAGQAVHFGSTVQFSLNVKNFDLVPIEEGAVNVYGQGHYRVYIDNKEGLNYALATHETQGLVTLPANLTLGPHTFTVALFNNDGTPLGIETEVWLDVVPPDSPVVQVIGPPGGTPFALGSLVSIESEVAALELVPESGINQVGQGHLEITAKETGELVYTGDANPSEFVIPADLSIGLQEFVVQLVSNTGSTYPNAKASAFLEVWETPGISVDAPEGDIVVQLGEALELEVSVSGATLVPEADDAVNKVGEVHYSVFLGDELLLQSAESSPSVEIPVDLAGGAHTLSLELQNNDGTWITGATTTKDFTLELPQVDILRPDGMTEVYVPDGLMYLQLNVSFFDLISPEPGLLNVLGEGHYLLYLDNATGADFFYKGSEVDPTVPLPADLAPGEHTLKVVLVNNVNTAIGVEKTQAFEVAAHGLSILSPEKGVEVVAGEALAMDLKVGNFTLSPVLEGAENVEGVGHYAIFLDDAEEPLLTDVSLTPLVTLDEGVELGSHMLHVVLMQNDGTPVEPGIEVTLPISVVEAE